MSARPLSRAQKTQIGIHATAAWQHQTALGAVDLPADMAGETKTARMKFWQHQIIADVTQRVCSASDMIDDEYLDVKAKFQSLSGESGKAYDTAHRSAQDAACHRSPGCEYVRDLNHWLAKAGYQSGYAIAIMKAKFRGITDYARLSEFQLKQLHDTIVNRCRQKLGLGEPDNRNKKQRAARHQPAPADASDSSDHREQKSRTYTLKPAVPFKAAVDDLSDLPPSKIPF